MLGTSEVRTEYTYTDAGQIATMKHNTAASTDVTYNFQYDVLTRPTVVKVGTQPLSTTSYNANGTVSQVVYGNGNKAVYGYDNYKRLTGVKFDGASTNRFSYGYDAEGRVAYVKDSVRNTTVKTLYDLAGRPMRKTQLAGTAHAYTGEVSYNQYELLSKFTETIGTNITKYTTTFAYDSENKPTTITYGTGSFCGAVRDGKRSADRTGNSSHAKAAHESKRQRRLNGCSLLLTYTWDKLNRITKRRAKPGTTNIDTTYTYYGGGHGTNSTTNLIKTIVQSGITLTYTYDDNGNITKISDGTKQTQYYYDAIGQLTRVNDQFDTRSSANGTTWVYTYDLGGNITTRKRYAYVADTGTLGTVESTATWTYGNSNWKDQLTAYGSAAITYDNSGNPLSDGTYTYTWAQGRRSRLQPFKRRLRLLSRAALAWELLPKSKIWTVPQVAEHGQV